MNRKVCCWQFMLLSLFRTRTHELMSNCTRNFGIFSFSFSCSLEFRCNLFPPSSPSKAAIEWSDVKRCEITFERISLIMTWFSVINRITMRHAPCHAKVIWRWKSSIRIHIGIGTISIRAFFFSLPPFQTRLGWPMVNNQHTHTHIRQIRQW